MAHRIIESNCPYCGQRLDAVTGLIDDGLPIPGDITACTYCFRVIVFGDELILRKPTKEEANEMMASKENIQQIELMIAAAMAFRRNINADKN